MKSLSSSKILAMFFYWYGECFQEKKSIICSGRKGSFRDLSDMERLYDLDKVDPSQLAKHKYLISDPFNDTYNPAHCLVGDSKEAHFYKEAMRKTLQDLCTFYLKE